MSTPAIIVIVEDEASTRATLCGMLEDAGYKVIGLKKGADANQDGSINALDITKVERIIAGLD